MIKLKKLRLQKIRNKVKNRNKNLKKIKKSETLKNKKR